MEYVINVQAGKIIKIGVFFFKKNVNPSKTFLSQKEKKGRLAEKSVDFLNNSQYPLLIWKGPVENILIVCFNKCLINFQTLHMVQGILPLTE